MDPDVAKEISSPCRLMTTSGASLHGALVFQLPIHESGNAFQAGELVTHIVAYEVDFDAEFLLDARDAFDRPQAVESVTEAFPQFVGIGDSVERLPEHGP
nr:hypothetical protein [Nocardia macrotermitis]